MTELQAPHSWHASDLHTAGLAGHQDRIRWLTYGNPKTVRKLGEQGNKTVLGWVMKEGLIPSSYVRSVKMICFWLNERVRLMVLNGVAEYSRKRIPTLFAGV
ncbi:hypothetical protein TNCV_2797971 [Trichonephila clavipes]|nr:hypothetical protein TNCV_2797971 [Trichonephila clavipes]